MKESSPMSSVDILILQFILFENKVIEVIVEDISLYRIQVFIYKHKVTKLN